MYIYVHVYGYPLPLSPSLLEPPSLSLRLSPSLCRLTGIGITRLFVPFPAFRFVVSAMVTMIMIIIILLINVVMGSSQNVFEYFGNIVFSWTDKFY